MKGKDVKKCAGELILDIKDLVKQSQSKNKRILYSPLQRCPDKKSKLTFKAKVTKSLNKLRT